MELVSAYGYAQCRLGFANTLVFKECAAFLCSVYNKVIGGVVAWWRGGVVALYSVNVASLFIYYLFVSLFCVYTTIFFHRLQLLITPKSLDIYLSIFTLLSAPSINLYFLFINVVILVLYRN